MKIGLIGDVHAQDTLLAQALSALRQMGVDTILCTGDIADGRGSVDDCCALLQREGVLAVAGNHDRWFLLDQLRDLPDATRRTEVSPATLQFLSALPKTITLDTPLGSLLLCHGLGENDMASVAEDEDGYALQNNFELHELIGGPHALVVNGHTHQSMVRAFHGLVVTNAGTLEARQSPCFLLMDTDATCVCRFELPVPLGSATRVWQLPTPSSLP